MRIIAGEARGRALAAPKGTDTRPTLDRVRESLFNILCVHVPGSRVLDLFAGSGALGLEALSRGAESAVFVDRARAAQAVITRNIETLGYGTRASLLCCDWRSALQRLSAEGKRFDLVFLDPPYRMAGADDMLRTLLASGLVQDALAVYEHDAAHPPAAHGWALSDRRTYGDTAISFLQSGQ